MLHQLGLSINNRRQFFGVFDIPSTLSAVIQCYPLAVLANFWPLPPFQMSTSFMDGPLFWVTWTLGTISNVSYLHNHLGPQIIRYLKECTLYVVGLGFHENEKLLLSIDRFLQLYISGRDPKWYGHPKIERTKGASNSGVCDPLWLESSNFVQNPRRFSFIWLQINTAKNSINPDLVSKKFD